MYVYILTNVNNTTLYIGVTNDIKRRIAEHKSGINEGFTKRYNLNKLIFLEETDSIEAAIDREKQLKRWRRDKKVDLIYRINPEWEEIPLV